MYVCMYKPITLLYSCVGIILYINMSAALNNRRLSPLNSAEENMAGTNDGMSTAMQKNQNSCNVLPGNPLPDKKRKLSQTDNNIDAVQIF